MSSSFIALRSRNYRLLWFGLLISMSGSVMRNAAVLWHVSLLAPKEYTAVALGGVGLVRIFPIIIFSMIAGVVADAVDRRKLMMLTNTAMLLVSTTLAVITFMHWDNVWLVYLLAAMGSAIGSFDGPARQSLFPTLVPREHLPNAISLNSIMFQLASVVGPAIGGLIIAIGGVAWVYVFDAISFVALIGSLWLMRDVPARPAEERGEISFKAAWEGLRFVFTAPLIRSSMLLDFFATFFASANALLPLFAQTLLPPDPILQSLIGLIPFAHLEVRGVMYGLLQAGSALGAFVTSAAMAYFTQRITRRGMVLIGAIFVYGLATVFFGLSTSFWMAFICLVISGAADMVSTVLRNIIRQLTTPDGMRGRMTSVNMVFFMGGPQLGELEAGLVGQAFGPIISVISGGVGCILATALVVWNTPQLRAYRKEDLPQTASAAAQ